MPRSARGGGGRLAGIERALAGPEPLAAVRELIPEDARNREQDTFVWAFACLLETADAGLTILLDRFGPDELGRIAAAAERLGAAAVSEDLATLRKAFAAALAAGRAELDASDTVAESAAGRAIAKKHARHVAELEEALLRFARQHARQLAGA